MELPSRSQATCSVRWRMGDESEANARELALISGRFGDMELYSSFCAELRVPLEWVGVLGESLELPKGSQVTCHV